MNYSEAVTDKKFIPNVVIKFKDYFWAIRQPDAGIVIDPQRLAVEQVAINPTKVAPFKVNTTINTYTFRLIDKSYAVTLLFDGVTKFFQNEKVEIYIGRCGVGMNFSEYLKLPDTFVKSVTKDGNSYSFNTTEAKDRLNRPAFNEKSKLEVDILAATTEIDAAMPIDPTRFPTAGLLKIDNEFISYASLDLVNNRFSGCIRGEKNSIPETHEAGETIYLVHEILDNPVNILLQCLISKGGGGIYDVLPDGAGVDESLINIEKVEALRDEFFLGQNYNLLLYGVENILNFLEEEILYPNELRIVSDSASKISLIILNRKVFDDMQPIIDKTTLIKQPAYSVDDSDITNVVEVEYDYYEPTGKFRKLLTLEDADSIADFGRRDALSVKLKGVKSTLDGEEIATNIAQRFLNRFAYPKPEISFSTHLDKSLVQLGDKPELVSENLPSDTGELFFAETVEVIERGINWKTGDVKFKVAFTSFTGIRECYLAPSDSVTMIDEKTVQVGAGRGSLYRVGWKMRLYVDTFREYVSEQVNEIVSIDGDVITFANNWTNLIYNDDLKYDAEINTGFLLMEDGSRLVLDYKNIYQTQFRIMFCDYDDAADSQRRYCFISNAGLNFNDGKKSYQITL